jgi:hypothetical protein
MKMCGNCQTKKLLNYLKEIVVIVEKSIENEDMNGIDRINNKIAYIIKNCVSCCSVCNFMKRDISKDVFINKCIEIAKLHVQRHN